MSARRAALVGTAATGSLRAQILAARGGIGGSTARAGARALAASVAGAAPPAETIADDTSPFFSALTVTGTWGALQAQVLFDLPDEDILGDRALSTEYRVTMPTEAWPDITRGATVTIGAGTYLVRGADILGDGRIKAVDLTLTAGTGPTTFADEASLAEFFDIPGFAVPARWGSLDAQVLLDLPDEDIFGGRAQSAGYRVTVRASDWPGIARGAVVNIAPATYTVREVRHVGDGATVEIRMSKP